MPPYGVAIRSFLKMLKNQDFQDTDSHTSDVGHSLQVLGDEGALELVRAFGRFAMTEYLLCLQSEETAPAVSSFCAVLSEGRSAVLSECRGRLFA